MIAPGKGAVIVGLFAEVVAGSCLAILDPCELNESIVGHIVQLGMVLSMRRNSTRVSARIRAPQTMEVGRFLIKLTIGSLTADRGSEVLELSAHESIQTFMADAVLYYSRPVADTITAVGAEAMKVCYRLPVSTSCVSAVLAALHISESLG